MDIKERFLTFETAKGIYLVPAGVVIMWAARYYAAFVIQIGFGVFGGYMVFEGLRKIFVNRIKQSLARDQLKSTRLADSGEPTVTAKVPAPE